MDKCSQLGFWDWATHNDNLTMCILLVCGTIVVAVLGPKLFRLLSGE